MNPNYLTPRIAIAHLTSLNDLQTITKQLQLRHKQYYHFFNLTNAKLPAERDSSFKWRGIPFSLTEVFKLLSQLDAFLRINIANAAVICVATPITEEYAKIIVKSYIDLCLISAGQNPNKSIKNTPLLKLSQSIVNSHPYFTREVQQVYRTISVHSPPIKILESFTIHPQQLFIPLVEIFNEGRYNDFESVYSHAIEEDLAVYYLTLNRPLETGIGKKYYDNRPETKYFSKPVVVFGDVKIVIHSYKTLKKVYELTLGFNTLNIDALNPAQHQKKVLKLENSDIYDRTCNSPQLRVEIEYSDYCDGEGCREQASCSDCRDLLKKMSNRYGEVQQDLQKFHRTRTMPQIQTLLSL